MNLYTELADRVLRFDGISVIGPEQLELFLLKGLRPSQLQVTELTSGIDRFNRNVQPNEQIKAFDEYPITLDLTWVLPEEYLSLDVEAHVMKIFEQRLASLKYTDGQIESAIIRIAEELAEYQQRGLNDLLRVMIYVLDKFHEANQVWGVGRGSSCASFILFLLGLHVVDVIKFNVSLEEFFHD